MVISLVTWRGQGRGVSPAPPAAGLRRARRAAMGAPAHLKPVEVGQPRLAVQLERHVHARLLAGGAIQHGRLALVQLLVKLIVRNRPARSRSVGGWPPAWGGPWGRPAGDPPVPGALHGRRAAGGNDHGPRCAIPGEVNRWWASPRGGGLCARTGRGQGGRPLPGALLSGASARAFALPLPLLAVHHRSRAVWSEPGRSMPGGRQPGLGAPRSPLRAKLAGVRAPG